MIAYFAVLNSDNQVINTICVDQADVDANGNDQSIEAENFVKTNLLKDESALVKQFSDDGSFRVNRAETNGGYYDPSNDVFIYPKPFSSWTLNNTNWQWESPVEMPDPYTDETVPDYSYAAIWDEDNQEWYAFNTNEDKVTWNPNTSTWE